MLPEFVLSLIHREVHVSPERLRFRAFTEDDRIHFVSWHTRADNRTFKWDGYLSTTAANEAFD